MFLIYMYYRYHERAFKFIKTKREKTINKYKRRWLTKYNPDLIVYQTAIDSSYYKPAKLSKETAEKLGEAFIRVDRQLKNGFSR